MKYALNNAKVDTLYKNSPSIKNLNNVISKIQLYKIYSNTCN